MSRKEHSAISVPDLNFDLLLKEDINYHVEIERIGKKITKKLEPIKDQISTHGVFELFHFEQAWEYYSRFEDERFELLLDDKFRVELLDISKGPDGFIELGIDGCPDLCGGVETRFQLFFLDQGGEVSFLKVGFFQGEVSESEDLKEKDALRIMIFADRVTDLFLNMCMLPKRPNVVESRHVYRIEL